MAELDRPALTEYLRLLGVGVSSEVARVLAVEVTTRAAVRGDDERAYWRHAGNASPAARAAHARYSRLRRS